MNNNIGFFADILKSVEGKENPSTVEKNLGLVLYVCKRYTNSGVSMEDLFQIGSIGLIKAVNTFDSEKNFKLATYATRCIENEILMHLRKNKRYSVESSIYEPFSVGKDGEELYLSDVLGTDGEEISANIEKKEEKQRLYNALSSLNEKDRRVIILRFGLQRGGREYTQKEVADSIGVSQSYLSRIEKRILSNLRHCLSVA